MQPKWETFFSRSMRQNLSKYLPYLITIPQMLENVNQIMIVLLIFNKRVGKEIFWSTIESKTMQWSSGWGDFWSEMITMLIKCSSRTYHWQTAIIGKYDDNDFQVSRSTADCETARKEAEIANKETRKKVSGHKSPIENKSAGHRTEWKHFFWAFLFS